MSSATVNLTAGAGSSSLLVLRGSALAAPDSTDPFNPPFEVRAFAAEPAASDPNIAKIRIVHAARGFRGVNVGLCNCTTADLDVYIDVAGTDAQTATPVLLNYDAVSTGYIELPGAEYNISATEAGNPSNVRVNGLPQLSFPGGSVTTLVIKDSTFGSTVTVIPVDDRQQ